MLINKSVDQTKYGLTNEEKSAVAERFIRTLKTKIYRYMTSISTNVYIDKLDDMVNEYNSAYHRTVDVKDNAYIDSTELHSNKKTNDRGTKFKVGDHVKISKYKNIFAKGYTPNWPEEVFIIKELKIQFHRHMLVMISMVRNYWKILWKRTTKY